MDEQQKTEGINIQVKTTESTNEDLQPEQMVNDTQAPPEQEVVIEEKDVDAVNSAVDGISDTPASVEGLEVNSEVEGIVEAPGSTEESDQEAEGDSSGEPELKEAPESTEGPEPLAPENLQPKPDPFMPKSDDALIAAAAPTTAPQSMSNNEQSLPHEHRNNKKFAVIITILLAIILAGAAVYVYMSAESNAKETTKTTIAPKAQNVAEILPANSADVDATLRDIDQTVKSIDDEADLSEASISDTTLGL